MIQEKIATLHQEQFTGLLTIESAKGHKWDLIYCLGQILWIEGGYHPYRAWQRNIQKYLAQVKWAERGFVAPDNAKYLQYKVLIALQKKNLVNQQQICQLLISTIKSNLFDIYQAAELGSIITQQQKALAKEIIIQQGFVPRLNSVDTGKILLEVQQSLTVWQQKGLKSISPNLAPKIKNLAQLQAQVPEAVYRNFVRLIDGKKTFHDLAIALKQDTILLTCSLLPYLRKSLLALTEVQDIAKPDSLKNSSNTINPLNSETKPTRQLIVCIDDSPQICRTLEQIINKAGYKFYPIQQALQAIPKLISSPPDLIFLDIGMPMINGYELCTQIRQISKLKEIPIVMLTGSDHITNRVRSKVAGCSEFIPKPIDEKVILATIEKFLGANTNKKRETAAPPAISHLKEKLSQAQ